MSNVSSKLSDRGHCVVSVEVSKGSHGYCHFSWACSYKSIHKRASLLRIWLSTIENSIVLVLRVTAMAAFDPRQLQIQGISEWLHVCMDIWLIVCIVLRNFQQVGVKIYKTYFNISTYFARRCSSQDGPRLSMLRDSLGIIISNERSSPKMDATIAETVWNT